MHVPEVEKNFMKTRLGMIFEQLASSTQFTMNEKTENERKCKLFLNTFLFWMFAYWQLRKVRKVLSGVGKGSWLVPSERVFLLVLSCLRITHRQRWVRSLTFLEHFTSQAWWSRDSEQNREHPRPKAPRLNTACASYNTRQMSQRWFSAAVMSVVLPNTVSILGSPWYARIKHTHSPYVFSQV